MIIDGKKEAQLFRDEIKKEIESIKSKNRNPILDKGRHSRARLGFILMSTDLAAESDFFDIAPKDVAVHVTRLKTDDYTTNETLSKHIEFMADAASRIQPDTKPNVISYSCTSGSIVIGEDRVKEEIKKGAPYAIPMTLVTGVVDALKVLKVKNLVVGTPYLDEINTKEAEFLINKGSYAMAILEFQDAISYDPNASTIHISISDAYRRLGRMKRVEDHLRIALDLEPGNVEAKEMLGQFFITEKNYSESQKIFLELDFSIC